MELENWKQILLIVIGVLVLWGVAGVALKLARKVIGCGCSLIVALAVLYFLIQYLNGL
jgi:hypothetical protein